MEVENKETQEQVTPEVTETPVIDLKSAQEAVIKDMAEREAQATEALNKALEEIAKQYRVNLSFTQPQIKIAAIA